MTGLLYIIIEFLAGLTACGLFLVYAPRLPDGGLAGGLLVVKPGAEATNTAAVFMEMFCAFILVTVVFRTAAGVKEPRFVEGMDDKQLRDVRHKKRQVYIKKHYAPIAIGFTLGFLAFVSSYVSGGAYNPARALGGCVVGTDCSDIWIYFIGDFVGGALAGLFHYWFFEIPHTEASDELADAYDADYCGL